MYIYVNNMGQCLKREQPIFIRQTKQKNQPLFSLHTTAKDGMVGMFEVLLEKGADVDARNEYGHTPLMLASKGENGISSLEIVTKPLEAGADVNLQDRYGEHALMSWFVNLEDQVRWLLTKQEDREVQGGDGYTALMLAAWTSCIFTNHKTFSPEIVLVLISAHYKDAFKDKDLDKFNNHVKSIEKYPMGEPIWKYIRVLQKRLKTAIQDKTERLEFICNRRNRRDCRTSYNICYT